MRKNMVGIEIEYLARSRETGKYRLIPTIALTPLGGAAAGQLGYDAFPVLGEVLSRPGECVENVVIDTLGRLEWTRHVLAKAGYDMLHEARARIGLKLYQSANLRMSQVDASKGQVLNVDYPEIDVTAMTDQVVEDGKIQGCYVSCGMHVHFSSWEEYSPEALRRFLRGSGGDGDGDGDGDGKVRVTEPLKAANMLTAPVVERIVRQLDKDLFGPLVAQKDLLGVTKYRHPGCFRLQPHGFEYRSLPATPETLSAEVLTQIVEASFRCLELLPSFERYAANDEVKNVVEDAELVEDDE